MPRAKVTVSIKALKSAGLDKLRNSAKGMAESVRATEKALSNLNTTSKTTAGSEKAIDSSSRSYDKLSKTLNSTSSTAKRAQDALTQNSSGIQTTSKAANRLNQSFTKVDSAALSISNSLGRTVQSLKKQKTALQENSRTVDNTFKRLNQVRVAFEDLAFSAKRSVPEIRKSADSLGTKFTTNAKSATVATTKWGVSVFRTLTGLDAADETINKTAAATENLENETHELTLEEQKLVKATDKVAAAETKLKKIKEDRAATEKVLKKAASAENKAKTEAEKRTKKLTAAEKALKKAKKAVKDVTSEETGPRPQAVRKLEAAERNRNKIIEEQNRLKRRSAAIEKQLIDLEEQKRAILKKPQDEARKQQVEEIDTLSGDLAEEGAGNVDKLDALQGKLKNSTDSLKTAKEGLARVDKRIADSHDAVKTKTKELDDARSAAENASKKLTEAEKAHGREKELAAESDKALEEGTNSLTKAQEAKKEALKKVSAEQQKAVKGSKTAEQAQERLAKVTRKTASANTQASASAQGLHERNRGLGKVTNNSSRQFASLSEGIVGGIVPAYAALAANVFAVSAAFEFLRKAGDLVTLNTGQVIYASSTGKAIRSLTHDVIAATDAQIAYEDAAQATAIGLASGLSPDQLIKLGRAARDVSVILGRDLTDSFNRLVRGVTKAEPELLDELGIVLRLKEATTTYAAALGLGAEDLNAYQRSQAVANDVLTQAENKYGQILEVVDPVANSFRRLGVAFDESFRSFRRGTARLTSGISEVLVDLDLLRNSLTVFAGISLLNFSSNKGITRIAGDFSNLFGKFTRTLVDSTKVSAAQFGILGDQARKTGAIIREETAVVRGVFSRADEFGLSPARRGSLRDRVARGKSVGAKDIRALRGTRDALLRRARPPEEVDGKLIFPGLRTEALRESAKKSAKELTATIKTLDKTSVTTFTKVQQRGVQALAGITAGFKALGTAASATLTLTANFVRFITLAAPYLAVAFTAITIAIAAFRKEKVLTEKEEELRFLGDRIRSVNTEFERFYEIQRLLARQGGDSLRYINALANNIGSLDIVSQDLLFDEILSQLPEETRKQQATFTLLAAYAAPVQGLSDITESQSVFDLLGGSDNENIQDFIKRIDELLKGGRVLDQYFEGSSVTLSNYLNTLEELRNTKAISPERFRELTEELARQQTEVEKLRDSTNNYLRLRQENIKAQDRVIANFIPQSEEATLVKHFREELTGLREQIVDRRGGEATQKQREDEASLIRRIALFEDIDTFNRDRVLQEKEINRLAKENRGLLTPRQQARQDIRLERRRLLLREKTAKREIINIREVADVSGRLNEQQAQAVDLKNEELDLIDTELENLAKREAVLERTQRAEARFNRKQFEAEHQFAILSANQEGRVKERLDLEKQIAVTQVAIDRALTNQNNILAQRVSTTQGYNRFQTEAERSARRVLLTAQQQNAEARIALQLLDQRIRNEQQLRQLREGIAIDRANVRGTQFQREDLELDLNIREIEIDNTELRQQKRLLSESITRDIGLEQEVQNVERGTLREIQNQISAKDELLTKRVNIFDRDEDYYEQQRNVSADLLELRADEREITDKLADSIARVDALEIKRSDLESFDNRIDAGEARIQQLQDEYELNRALLRIDQERELERIAANRPQFLGPRAQLSEQALSDFEVSGIDFGQLVHGQGTELLSNRQHAILDFTYQIRDVQQDQLDTIAAINKIIAARLQSTAQLTDADIRQLTILAGQYYNQTLQEAQIKRNQAATQALLELENKRLEAQGKQSIRNAAAEVATTANQREILERANQLHEIREQAFLLQEEINLLESDLIKDTASEETEEQLQARRDELAVLLLQEQALERQINLTTQLIDTMRQSLETNVQQGIASFLKGEESSITDLIRTIGKGVLESAADNLAKNLTNILFGNEQDKIAERQADIIESGMRDAADYHADRIRSAVDDTTDADTMSPITVNEFVAGRGGIAEVLENIDSGFTGLFNDLKIGLDNILGNIFSNNDFLSTIFGFRNGGIASGGFRAFANGGVIDRPTVGIVGEGRYNEAVVPLPDGKSIPVETRETSGPTNVSVNVYVSNDGSATSETEGLDPVALGDAVAGAVQREIQKQKRPGGMLNRYGVA